MQTARLWRSLGCFDSQGNFHIDGVTGPDEYSALADNNVYTNLMAQQNMRAAADAVDSHPIQASALTVTAAEVQEWRRAADAMTIPYDSALGVHPQADGFTRHEAWDFAATSKSHYPLLRHFPYFELYRKQVVKQADLVLAMQLHPEAFTAEQKARNFAYYERLTVRDSSLSAATQAVIATEVGHLQLAHDYLGETALIDLDDTERNVRDGLHLGALAGAWTAAVGGLGGLRCRSGVLAFAPRLPPAISRLAFSVCARGQSVRAEITSGTATYLLANGPPMQVSHHGDPVTLIAGQPVAMDVPPPPAVSPVSQPRRREPARRRPGRAPA